MSIVADGILLINSRILDFSSHIIFERVLTQFTVRETAKKKLNRIDAELFSIISDYLEYLKNSKVTMEHLFTQDNNTEKVAFIHVSFWYLSFACYNERNKAVNPTIKVWTFNLHYMEGKASRKGELTQLITGR